MTTFITPIALLSNYKNIYRNVKYFLISFLILETLQIALFVVLDLFLFYVFFESVLPVLFIIIIVYGSGVNRIRSALLFFLYTLAGSLFMLLAVLQIYSYVGSTDFQLISLNEISLESQKILFLAFFLAFAVKTPLWPLTGWLYRAHADSPLAGSILLAGTILKFATYGALCLGLTQICAYKLSNSGDTLKLIVPSSIRKYISGQNNYLGMVTSYKMIESEMGYRGSKSEFKTYSVKEQRVDGSWIHSFKQSNSILRYTLMAFERKYQTKNPSKQIVIPASFLRRAKNFSTYSQCKNLFQSYNPSIYPEQFLKTDVIIKKLEPWFVTGFTDAEGCFGFYLYKTAYSNTGWSISLVFQISLHEKDKNILEQIQNYFGVGGITSHGKTSLKYSVRSYNDMQKIIDHFDKYPLITNKLNDYKLFKLTYFLILQKEHLSLEGIKKLVLIKSSMNLGLSPELKAHFPDLTVQPKEKISDYKIKDPQWVAGFSSGEACFIVDINKSKSNQIGYSVNLRIMISQHARDELLLCSLINYINCGKLYKNNNSFNLTVRKFADIETKIIPFFIKYPILGNKFLDFQDFCKVSKLVKEKKHLQIDGFKKISLIKSGMNTKRV